MCIKKILLQAIKKKMIDPFDFYFATYLFEEKNTEMILAALCTNYVTRRGHAYLDIKKMNKKTVFPYKYNNLTEKLWNFNQHVNNWITFLSDKMFVYNKIDTFPLFFEKNKLYIKKIWIMKNYINKFFFHKKVDTNIDLYKAKKIIQNISEQNYDVNQNIAISISLIKKITCIIGGPGTGKTTTVTKILLSLLRLYKNNIKIKICAPTGKAATILLESLHKTLKIFQTNIDEIKKIPKTAFTLHELILLNNKKKYNCNNNNNNVMNILIIDEASMIDLVLMYNLLKSIKKKTKVIFLGDFNQLPSIRIKSILALICKKAKNIYNIETAKKINFLTNEKIIFRKKNIPTIYNSIHKLQKNYRFQLNSPIYTLSQLILKQKNKAIFNLFNEKKNKIKFYPIINEKMYHLIINKIFFHYCSYWESITENTEYESILKKFNKFRVLCAVNEGYFGTNKINLIIEKMIYNLYFKKKKNQKLYNENEWYFGKTIIITKNQKILGVFNGEIGIVLKDKNQTKKVFFHSLNGKKRSFNPELIKYYQPAWCTTVHKAQGSEFSKIYFIIPNNFICILSASLIYTAVTRAKKEITIFGDKKIIEKMIQNKNC
ncbi:RecBCD enzyme subunit RecD [Buchnera aphidicola (Thelaxes suberi)]|uniref:exodeoxyribonuclease V subunit alpha n=1 Tax=Buchnera aphidicola TaxID=9 RepID=UPI003464D352